MDTFMTMLYILSIETTMAHWTVGIVMQGINYPQDVYLACISEYPHLSGAHYKFLLSVPVDPRTKQGVLFVN